MKVFITGMLPARYLIILLTHYTGASGWIGRHVVPELLAHGHTVLGLARSPTAADKVRALGAEVHHGSLEDHQSLQQGARTCDGIIHLGFIHDFASPGFDYARNMKVDYDAITAMAEVIKGTGKPLIITGGTVFYAPGKVLVETDIVDSTRGGVEAITRASKDEGWRGMAMRLAPSNHGDGDAGFIPALINIARTKGYAGHVGEDTRWTACHVKDTAVLYRLALEKGEAGKVYHAIADEAITTKAIAETIGKKTGLEVRQVDREDAKDEFGFLGMFVSTDAPVSNKLTKEWLNWEPEEVGLLGDLEHGKYVTA
jgi:nucleoside-diphosphate-sugar epimerase